MKKPNLFIVGEAKCGTTALHYFLSQHPEIYMSELKEPNYFNKDFHKKAKKLKRKAGFLKLKTDKDYLKLFKSAKNEKIIGEATPDYLMSEEAAKRIAEFNPNAKIIAMFREPVSYLYSLHSQLVFNLAEPEKDFLKALALEKERKKGRHLPKSVAVPDVLFYSERAKFAEHLKRFYKYFKKSQIKVIIFEEFIADNKKTYKEVLEFLGVDKGFIPEFKIVNANKELRIGSLKKLANAMSLPGITAKLPKPLRKLLALIFDKLTYKNKKRKKLDEEAKKILMKRYKKEVLRLSKLLNKDLVKLWGYDKI